MALSPLQLMQLGLGDDGPGKAKPKPTPKPAPGLTGADLEYAKAERERDAADKTADSATGDVMLGDLMHGGVKSLGGGAYDVPPGAARRGFDRQQAANHTSEQAQMDMNNIRNLVAALHAHVNK